jgi:hypothetical protein
VEAVTIQAVDQQLGAPVATRAAVMQDSTSMMATVTCVLRILIRPRAVIEQVIACATPVSWDQLARWFQPLVKIFHTRMTLMEMDVKHLLMRKHMVMTGVLHMETSTTAREKQMCNVASAAVEVAASSGRVFNVNWVPISSHPDLYMM